VRSGVGLIHRAPTTISRRFGHVAITAFIEAGYASYLSGVLDDFYPFTSLLVTVGLLGVNTARTAIVDGPVIFKTHRTCMLLQNGLQWRLPACAIILVLMHLVLGDPQLRCFVLPIIKVSNPEPTTLTFVL
jgi:hypothetical protein